jgi:hypothetical protein
MINREDGGGGEAGQQRVYREVKPFEVVHSGSGLNSGSKERMPLRIEVMYGGGVTDRCLDRGVPDDEQRQRVERIDGATQRGASRCGSCHRTFGATTEPEPFVVRLQLADGPRVELTGLGHMRTQFLAVPSDARGDEVAGTMLPSGVGDPEA